MWRWLWTLGMVWVLTACSYKKARYDVRAAAPYKQDTMDVMMARSMAAEMDFDAEVSPAPSPQAPPPTQPARKVHYNGYLRLDVASVEEGILAVTDAAKGLGGDVEQVHGASVTVRVPVGRFDAAMDALAALGEVLDRSITAEDVTEAFTATDLRLSTAKATRDRLILLLAKATDEREKLELVKQIQRVGEQIDQLEAQVRVLADLAARSRITVDLTPRDPLAFQDDEAQIAELAWVRALSPFRRDVETRSKPLRLGTPEGLIALDERGAQVASSAGGSLFWTHRLANAPQGDRDFWEASLRRVFSRDFGEVKRQQVGDFSVVTLVERANDPYHWMIAVRVVGRDLQLVQAYLPDPAEVSRYEAAILEVLRAAGGEA